MTVTIYCMITSHVIRNYVSTAEAAEMLGVSQHQAWALASSGVIEHVTLADGAFALDRESVLRYRAYEKQRGRPFAESQALSIYVLLSGCLPTEISDRNLARIKAFLSGASIESILWKTRKRGRVERYITSPSLKTALSSDIKLTGTSREALEILGIVTSGDSVDGYANESERGKLCGKYQLKPSQSGDVTIRWIQNGLNGWQDPVAPRALLYADLFWHPTSRVKTLATEGLKGCLDDFKNSQGKRLR